MRVNMNRLNKHSGYTLLELMIAGVIGLILMLGVMQIYLSASRTNNFQSSVIEVQDKGRFILAILEKDLQRAGWSNLNPGVNLGTLDSHIDFTQSSNNDGYNSSDSISIRYESDDETGVDANYSCDGTSVAAGEIITNTYSVGSNGTFQCTGNTRTVALLTGVESLHILYGVENNTTLEDGIVDGYVNRAAISGYEELVATVRLGILVKSTNEPLEQANTNTYQILDELYNPTDDRALRRLFIKTILLPNKPQAF